MILNMSFRSCDMVTGTLDESHVGGGYVNIQQMYAALPRSLAVKKRDARSWILWIWEGSEHMQITVGKNPERESLKDKRKGKVIDVLRLLKRYDRVKFKQYTRIYRRS